MSNAQRTGKPISSH